MPSEENKKELLERGRFEGEVLSQLKVIADNIARVERSSDSFRLEFKRDLEDLEQKTFKAINASDKRIQALEQWRWWLVGVGSVVVFLATSISNLVFSKIQTFL